MAVTGETNFAMPSTRLTVGGFTQPGLARSLIELPSNAEKGLSHRFLWVFPSPLFGKFSSLGEADKDFQRTMGKSVVQASSPLTDKLVVFSRLLLVHL